MGRLTFPEEGQRLVYTIGGDGAVRPKVGTAVLITTDSAGLIAADIQTTAGAAIPGSMLSVGSDSLIPLFLGPNDGRNDLYAVIGGKVYPLSAQVDQQIDVLPATYSPLARAVEGVPWFLASHSYGVVPPYNSSANRNYISRLQDELNPLSLTNAAVASYWAEDVASRLVGTDQPIGPNYKGLVIVDVGIGDSGGNGNAKSLAGITNGVRAIIAAAQAASKTVETNAIYTYTGSWSVQNGAGYGSGASKLTTTVNDNVSIALPPLTTGLNYTLLLFGTDSAKVSGCTNAEVKLDGTVISNLNLNDQMLSTTVNTSLPFFGVGAYPLQIAGNGNSRTLVITHKGSGGQNLIVDDLLIPQANPPSVVVLSQTPWSNASYAAAGGDTTLAAINAAIQSGITGFTGVTYVDMSNGWTPSSMCYSGDQLHPNDQGHANRARVLAAALNNLAYRNGLNIL